VTPEAGSRTASYGTHIAPAGEAELGWCDAFVSQRAGDRFTPKCARRKLPIDFCSRKFVLYRTHRALYHRSCAARGESEDDDGSVHASDAFSVGDTRAFYADGNRRHTDDAQLRSTDRLTHDAASDAYIAAS
jgi:hypothetical protein